MTQDEYEDIVESIMMGWVDRKDAEIDSDDSNQECVSQYWFEDVPNGGNSYIRVGVLDHPVKYSIEVFELENWSYGTIVYVSKVTEDMFTSEYFDFVSKHIEQMRIYAKELDELLRPARQQWFIDSGMQRELKKEIDDRDANFWLGHIEWEEDDL